MTVTGDPVGTDDASGSSLVSLGEVVVTVARPRSARGPFWVPIPSSVPKTSPGDASGTETRSRRGTLRPP